jgi:sarcosine oxidase
VIVRRAYELWFELERISGRTIYQRTGGIMIGEAAGALVTGTRLSALTHQVPTELLQAQDIKARYPQFNVPDDHVGLFEQRAGTLVPEAGIEAALGAARRAGAELRFDEPVVDWTPGGAISIRTPKGEYRSNHLILAGGAWMGAGLARVEAPLSVARQPLFWFEPRAGRATFHPSRFPIFIWQWTEGHSIYGFPDQGEGFKVAIHHEGQTVDPDTADRSVHPGEERELVEILERLIPGAAGPVLRSAICLYTNTRDEDFILDRHPADDRVVVASPCSGHGYKFAPAIGEILADLVTQGTSRFDLTPFRNDRPGAFGPRLYSGAHG